MTYPFSKGVWVEETWQNTCIIWQQRFQVYYVDMISFMSIKIFSPHDLYDGGVRGQQELFLWLLLGEYGRIFSILIMILLYDLYEGEIREQQELLLLWFLLGEYG